MGKVWKVKIRGETIHMGCKRCALLYPGGCNQPYLGRFWCPRSRWFRQESCPFINRRECDTFRRWCGNL